MTGRRGGGQLHVGASAISLGGADAPRLRESALIAIAIGARAADSFYFGGTTAEGDPSTRAHVIRYAQRLVALSIGGWILAQSIGL